MTRLSYEDYRRVRRFEALDGLRAVTVVGLIGHHFGAGRFQPLIGIGKITVFFVLSGFVITLLLLRSQDRDGRIRLRDFFLRRQFRLLPLYYTALAAYVVARYGIDGEWERLHESLPYYLVFLNEFTPVNPDITSFWHSWTLAYEQKFYVLWPVIFVLLSRFAPRTRPLWTLLLTLLCLAAMPLTNNASVHYFALFLGCFLAMLLHSERGFAALAPLTHPVVSAGVLAGFVVLHVSLPSIAGQIGLRASFACYAPGVALLLIAVLHNGVGRWVLTRKPLLFIGERGYALYLIHGLAGAAVISMAPQWGASPVRWVLICLVAVAFAEMAHRLVELPAAAHGRRFIRWLQQPTPPAVPAVPLPRTTRTGGT